MAPRTRGLPLEKSAKSHSGPLQPRPTHTPSRRCAPCSLACFHFFFRELPLLTRPHLTQPLLLTFETAGKSAFSSPYDVSVAAARQDICTISRELNKPCCGHPTACARFDPCTCCSLQQKELVKCATSVRTPLITHSAVCTQHITSPFPRSTACLTAHCTCSVVSY